MFAVILSLTLLYTYSYALDNNLLLNMRHFEPEFSNLVVGLDWRVQNSNLKSDLSECEAMFDTLGAVVLNYSRCVVNHSLYSNVCSNCVMQYTGAIKLYQIDFDTIFDDFGQRCSDRMNVSAGSQMKDVSWKYVHDSWNNLLCDGCFSNQSSGQLIPEYAQFFTAFNHLTKCILQATGGVIDIKLFGPLNVTTNHSVCVDCSGRWYKELDSIYTKIDTNGTNKVCQDIGDVMNYTRYVWRDVFGCKSRPKQNTVLWIVSAFLAALPVTFYIASHLNGSDVSKKLVRQKRLHNYAAAQNSPSCQ